MKSHVRSTHKYKKKKLCLTETALRCLFGSDIETASSCIRHKWVCISVINRRLEESRLEAYSADTKPSRLGGMMLQAEGKQWEMPERKKYCECFGGEHPECVPLYTYGIEQASHWRNVSSSFRN